MTSHLPGPDPIVLEHLTWPEVELALTRGMTTAVVPVGAVEQHGPHLPLLVDAERGTALGYRVARAIGDALLAPTIRLGCSEHHMGFAGTISLRPETLEAVCRDVCVSLARHGFQEVYLVPSHGGNFQPLEEMVPRLQEAVDATARHCRIVAFTDLLAIVGLWRWVAEEEAGLGRRVGGHADIAESSEMLHLLPELVRPERAERGKVGELDQALVDRIFDKGLRAITPNGILGDARGMSAELGERLLDATARMIAQAFREEEGAPQAAGGRASPMGAATAGTEPPVGETAERPRGTGAGGTAAAGAAAGRARPGDEERHDPGAEDVLDVEGLLVEEDLEELGREELEDEEDYDDYEGEGRYAGEAENAYDEDSELDEPDEPDDFGDYDDLDDFDEEDLDALEQEVRELDPDEDLR